jgi:excisionase family DNA binding protein
MGIIPVSTHVQQSAIPTRREATLAREVAALLAGTHEKAVHLRVGTRSESVTLPAMAVRLVVKLLEAVGEGHPVIVAAADEVTVTPRIEPEITTQEAADLLNVSRPHVVKLMEAGVIPHRKVGRHRRARLADVVAYKARVDAESAHAIDALVAQAQALGHGY